MSPIVERAAIVAFIVFCRVGAAIMTMPGLGGERVPMRIRLVIAVALTAMLTPVLWDAVSAAASSSDISHLGGLIISELGIGFVIGVAARMFFLALEGMGAAAAMSIGLSSVLGTRINESEPLPTVATFFVLGATTLFFALDLHWEFLRGLRQSYDVIEVGHGVDPESSLRELIRSLDQAFAAMLRLCSPLLLLTLVLNVAFGILNRMSPQVPIYFVTAPFLIAIGFYWIYMLTPDFMAGFVSALAEWLKS